MGKKLSKLMLLALFLGFLGCQLEGGGVDKAEISVGQRRDGVIGGQKDSRFPAVGALTVAGRTFCTGTLITPRFVITAAHCVVAAKGYRGRGASVKFRIDWPTGVGNNFKTSYYDIDKMETHPQYARTRAGIQNDLGYLVLKSGVPNLQPMPLLRQAMSPSWVGKKAFFIGYGLIQTTPRRISPNRKYSVEITIRKVLNDRFQTYDKGKSICSGDSGGPALFKLNGKYYLIGVNSYGTGRVSGGQPLCDGSGFSFRVDAYLNWLQPLMNRYGGKCKTDADCGHCYQCDVGTNKCVVKYGPKSKDFCKPCKSDADCGGAQNGKCVRTPVGFRCLQTCANCCPQQTACRAVALGVNQCAPKGLKCPDYQCQSDADCGPGEKCLSNVCKPAPDKPAPTLCKKCQKDSDCGAGSICIDYPDGKFCAQPCTGNIFCPTGYSCQLRRGKFYCVASIGACKCSADTDCYSGLSCIDGICKKKGGGKFGDICDDKLRACAKDYRCMSLDGKNRTCIKGCQSEFAPGSPGSTCAHARCSDGARCVQAYGGYFCFSPCTSNGQCRNGGVCTRFGSQYRFCICRSDKECKPGYFCNKTIFQRYGFCAKKRQTAKSCPAGFDCLFAGGSQFLCLPKPSQGAGEVCSPTKRCKEGLLCARTQRGTNVCIRRCSNDSSCSLEGGMCRRTPYFSFCHCLKDSDCKPGYRCKDISPTTKVCTAAPPCKSDSDCRQDEVCKKGRCVAKNGGCVEDSDCPSGQVCRERSCRPKVSEPSEESGDGEKVPSERISEGTGELPREEGPSGESVSDGGVSDSRSGGEGAPSGLEAGGSDSAVRRDGGGNPDSTAEIDTTGGCKCSSLSPLPPLYSVFYLPLLWVWMRRRWRLRR